MQALASQRKSTLVLQSGLVMPDLKRVIHECDILGKAWLHSVFVQLYSGKSRRDLYWIQSNNCIAVKSRDLVEV